MRGIGFKTADKLAAKMGVDPNSPYRAPGGRPLAVPVGGDARAAGRAEPASIFLATRRTWGLDFPTEPHQIRGNARALMDRLNLNHGQPLQ